MKLLLSLILILAAAMAGFASQASKTVGTSDPNYDYPTIAAALTALNAGAILDGNGNPADTVTLTLMDASYAENELVISPASGMPGTVVISSADSSAPATVTISQVSGSLLGLTVDSLDSFTLTHVALVLDTATAWSAGITIYQAKEWVRPCPSHIVGMTAAKGIDILMDSVGTVILRDMIMTGMDTACHFGGVTAQTIEIAGNEFDSVGAAIVMDGVSAGSIILEDNESNHVLCMPSHCRPAHRLIFHMMANSGDSASEDSNVDELRIARNTITGPGVDSTGGIILDSIVVHSLAIDSNSIAGLAADISIHCRETASLMVRGNDIPDTTGSSVNTLRADIDHYIDCSCTHFLVVSGNTFTGGSGAFIDLTVPQWGIVRLDMFEVDNTFSNSSGDGCHLVIRNNSDDTVSVLIEQNSFLGNSGNGLSVEMDSGLGPVIITVVSNTSTGNGGDGVYTRGRDGTSIFKDHRGQGHDNILVPAAVHRGGHSRSLTSADLPNSITANGGAGLHIDGNIDVPDGVHFQNLYGNGSYNFINGTDQPIAAENNWWGLTDSAAIAATIFDGNDSAGLGITSFVPFAIESMDGIIITAQYDLDDGWNLLSVPVIPGNPARTSLFPTAVSQAFAYAGSYLPQHNLANGTGYWLKFDGVQSQGVVGLEILSDTFDVGEGWNIIGSVTVPTAVTDIASIPGGVVTSEFFGYAGSYVVADTVMPGRGYWVKVDTTALLILAPGPAAAAASSKIRIVPTDQMPPAAPGDLHSDASGPGAPREFSLQQNYPNPFNPSTSIRFTLPMPGRVSVKVSDILGRDLLVLAEKVEMSPGTHTLQLDAAGLSSGIYFYEIVVEETGGETGNLGRVIFRAVRKMGYVK